MNNRIGIKLHLAYYTGKCFSVNTVSLILVLGQAGGSYYFHSCFDSFLSLFQQVSCFSPILKLSGKVATINSLLAVQRIPYTDSN